MNRFYGRATRAVTKSWQMYPIGLLFGLGFDTATEIALLATAGAAAAGGLPIYAILCLPILFAAGMSLLDTIDGAFMNFAYGWAFSQPIRKIFYNITITALSVVVALLIGTIELLVGARREAQPDRTAVGLRLRPRPQLRRLRDRRGSSSSPGRSRSPSGASAGSRSAGPSGSPPEGADPRAGGPPRSAILSSMPSASYSPVRVIDGIDDAEEILRRRAIASRRAAARFSKACWPPTGRFRPSTWPAGSADWSGPATSLPPTGTSSCSSASAWSATCTSVTDRASTRCVSEAEHAYAVCERCGRLDRLEAEQVEAVRRQIRRAAGFEAHFSHFPILGLCRDCAAGETVSPARSREHSHGDHVHSHEV